MITDLSRLQLEEWASRGSVFTLGEAWLDLMHVADAAGIVPVVSYTERWSWENQEVADFFSALERCGHIRPHDKVRWRLTYQGQDVGLKDDYEQVWRIYPKRVAKQKGYHAYAATRKGRNGESPTSARVLYDATVRYAKARKGEEAEFILNASTFFGPDNRWREAHRKRTSRKPKGNSQWQRPTTRDLTKITEPPTKGRSPTTTKSGKKSPPKKSRKKKDPLADL